MRKGDGVWSLEYVRGDTNTVPNESLPDHPSKSRATILRKILDAQL